MRFLTLVLLAVIALPAWAERETTQLEFYSDPAPGWSKNRLAGRLNDDNQGFEIYDMTPDAAPFDDAETFRVDSPVTLPYGDKRLTLVIEVDPSIETLWGNRLMQFQLNGKELEVGLNDDGTPSFEKEYGDDGKGFVPAKTGTYHFAVPKEITDVQFVSFMTAAASKFNMQVNEVSIDVWPEEDLRPRPYLIRYNRLGYLVDQDQPALLEWQPDLIADSLPLTIRQTSNGEREVTLTRSFDSKDSGLAVTPLSLELAATDYNTLIIPQTVKRTKHTTALFRTRDSLAEYEKQRDLALGAFHWFDMRTYPDAHDQDRSATIYGTDETKDVYGGWYDAGDYGRYSVNGAWSVYMVLLSVVANEQAFPTTIQPLNRTDGARLAVLDLVVPELEFLAKMQREDGALYHKVNSRDWPSITAKPTDDVDEKFIMPISTTATADVAAVMNLAAHLLINTGRETDKALAGKYLNVAQKAESFLANNPQRIMTKVHYDGAEYGGPYTDENDADERLLVAASKQFLGQPLTDDQKAALLAQAEQPRFGDVAPDWMHVNFLSVFTTLFATDDAELKTSLLALVEKEFTEQIAAQDENPYGLMYAGINDQFDWGSNGIIATLGLQLLWLEQLTDNTKYWDAAYKMSHWFFGLNPHGIIFTTGASRYNVARPHFRPLVSQAAPKPFGLLAGGPNSVALKGDQVAAAFMRKAPMQSYIDHQESYATNEVAINWQAAWASYLSLLTD